MSDLAAIRELCKRRKAEKMQQATQVQDDQENNCATINSQGGSGTHDAKRHRTGES